MNSKSKSITILGLMTAVMILFATTPIGSIPVGPLVISLQVIPVAICAIALGPVGGLVGGTIFGILSCLQAFGIGIPSAMGIALVGINPFLAIVQRLVPRMLEGLFAGLVFKVVSKNNVHVASLLAGFTTAFLNTLLFMSLLVVLFGNTDYMKESMAGRSILIYICASVGINAVVEWISATVIAGAVGVALFKAGILNNTK